MPQFGFLTCCAGLLAAAAASSYSGAVPIRSVTASPHRRNLDTQQPSFVQEATPPTAQDKTDACLPILDALRTEGLNGQLAKLTKASDDDVNGSLSALQKSGKTKVIEIAAELAGSDKTSCDGAAIADSEYPGLVIPFDHSTEFDCEALIDESFYAGLSHLQEKNYDPSAESSKLGDAPLDNLAAQNFAAILSYEAEKVACAATTDCAAGNNVLFCYFIPPLKKGTAKPINADVYEAVLNRPRGSASITIPAIAATLLSIALAMLS
ncbi:SAG family member [Eimeria necatrix]|uniref:SAG family member n=1 Tax=Eimeria necatrix TaxID=51315 RepID=U6MIC6_9EIME|nr:SAG family member [Eimeria necatrix]CDJ62199.1 SAG family member [Eimeria necatrix]